MSRLLEVETDVINGIIFIMLEGELTTNTVIDLENELNYLLYKQGMHFFVFNFKNLENIEYKTISWLENKLVEIFLSCGNVVMCGLNDIYRKKIGMQEKIFYTNSELDAIKLLSV